MIKALVFDLDDTLYPEGQFVLSGFRAVDNWLIDHLSLEGFYSIAHKFFQAGVRGNIFNLALREIGQADDPSLIEILVSIYRNHQPAISLYEDARWALNYFRTLLKLGLITDGFIKTQQNKVLALGLENSLDVLVYSDHYGRKNWKPSSLPYRKAMKALNTTGPECLYVGDNPRKDFITARALGWHTVQINRSEGEYSNIAVKPLYRAHNKIASLLELKELIRKKL